MNAQGFVSFSEKELQSSVLALAQTFGWRCYHTYNSRRSQPGFPDLTMTRARDGRLAFAELKQQRKDPTPEQEAWLHDLAQTTAEVYLWRPAEWFDGTIERVLR